MSRIEQIKKLLSEDSNDSFLNFALAKEYEKENDLSNAIHFYSKLMELDPHYVGVYYHLGKAYEEVDDSKKALEIYTKGITICKELKEHHALSELMGAKTNCEMGL